MVDFFFQIYLSKYLLWTPKSNNSPMIVILYYDKDYTHVLTRYYVMTHYDACHLTAYSKYRHKFSFIPCVLNRTNFVKFTYLYIVIIL